MLYILCVAVLKKIQKSIKKKKTNLINETIDISYI